jgi:hypothetical protein
MRRKLIKQDAFEQIANSSVAVTENELIGAERILSRAIGQDVSLHSFNESTVLFETEDGTYVHAGYQIDDSKLNFSNIEELVIDEQSKTTRRKEVLGEMLDSVLKDQSDKAEQIFSDYLKLSSFEEAKKFVDSKDEDEDDDDDDDSCDDKKVVKKDDKPKGKKSKKDAFMKMIAAKKGGDDIKEAYKVATNVLDYVEYMTIGPVLEESNRETDEFGSPVSIQIPTSRVRNEGKLLNFDWKVLNHKCKVLRSGAKSLCEDQEFVKAIADLKILNNVSNATGLEEALDTIAVNWPNSLYLTEEEMAHIIGESLQIAGEKNYDDQTCAFMAEAILDRVYSAYTEKATQILSLANAPKEANESYEGFKAVVEGFFPAIDEKTKVESKIFEDLYETVESIYKVADRRGNKELKSETAHMLNDIADVLNSNARPDVELAEEVANWIAQFVEANVTGATDHWNVSNLPHHTVNGDHPQMARNAKVPGIAGTHSGDWGDPAPMIGQDSMDYKGKHSREARSSSWGNIGKDTFPSLSNPYIPKPFGDYTMKGEKGVDKDTFGQHHGSWQSSDTWPALQNPYAPKEAGAAGGQGYKMKNGPETDLVVDRGVAK